MTKLRAPPISLLERYHGDSFQPLYTTTVRVTGGEAEHARASGVARSDDGNLHVDLRLPAELGGGGGGTNPEQLFAAGYAACFHGALSLLATRADIPIPGASVAVTVAFGRDPDDGLFMVTADVAIDLPGVERDIAEELVRNTERVCPYAKMARQGIVSLIVARADSQH
ncbi:Ohr family peroxiredoxin [Nannocystis sp. ILAH1]|uniref:Ohr family peroxiredoxin n=1 Tax=unclassified Nannocystis TaxID=2627009 RepID=UPI002271522C|nr:MULTISPECIES: Ohr family peroxiredoxin [unclassified Nannocystis]MCY0992586.1 Ohr family peroxiredoxin [Nannocystis sp. ILAH1]MCY1070188.1 Ohr family peroxiredoxin [Nannocystis sp. RBIL2]